MLLLFTTVSLLLYNVAFSGKFWHILLSLWIFWVTVLTCIAESTDSEAAAFLMSAFDDEELTVVNASCTVELLCLAYGSTSPPFIEWMLITNGKIAAIIDNSTYNQQVINNSVYSEELITCTVSVLFNSRLLLHHYTTDQGRCLWSVHYDNILWDMYINQILCELL